MGNPTNQILNPEEAILMAAYDSRGRILQQAIEMENRMMIYIMEYFTNDLLKMEEMASLILARVDLEYKYRAFLYLVEEYKKEFYNKHQAIISDIKGLIEIRNTFAHWPVYFSKQAQDNYDKNKIVTYVLIQKKDKKLRHDKPMTEKDINNIIVRFRNVNAMLTELIG